MCLYPRLITNRKYTENKKNSGEIPAVSDLRTLYVPIGCQMCIECRKKKAREWQVRLQEEIKYNKTGKFITLTLSNEEYTKINNEIPQTKIQKKQKLVNGYMKEKTKEIKIIGYRRDNEIATYAIRHFLERWRKEFKKSVRHWLVTELGHNGTENIHLHGIIWTEESYDTIERIWKYGFIWPRKYTTRGRIVREKTYVNNVTINYTTKYIYKTDEIHQNYISKVFTSPGIGKEYAEIYKNKYKPNETNETYRTESGHKIAIPIYYRNKIYTEEEKEKLWIEKLNKEERYVLGQKISIKKNEKEYYRALKQAQKTNDKMGYNNPNKAWKREKYEQERRTLMQQKRIKQ